ncbi:MAG: succinylglutamate desuccinylase/aspartoacylase family protein [Burkholderiales bacterium]|nr:succinylglutamate desuccinylase/aspartoacylase family protein [Burkholderiales bacterium]
MAQIDVLPRARGAVAQRLASMPAGARGDCLIETGNLASGAPLGIPVVLVKGARAGPCLWINGQVHGDEINGLVAALDFVGGLVPSSMAGSVVLTTTANPYAFDARRKRTPHDDLDLDQCFPGHAQGLASERLAYAMTEAMAGCADLLVSFHTMGSAFDCRPFAVYKQSSAPGAPDEAGLLVLMAQFAPSCACWMPIELREGELPGHLAGAIDYWMLEAGKPAFMIELGAGGRVDAEHVKQGVRGLTGVARKLGIVRGAAEADSPPLRVTRYRHATCARGGLFRRAAEPDTMLAAGQAYGHITDLYGKVVETLSFEQPALLVGVRRDPVVHSGDRVAFAALQWDRVAG